MLQGVDLILGNRATHLASDGVEQNWPMNSGSMTPAYMSDWDDCLSLHKVF
jgi:hypothetical protein